MTKPYFAALAAIIEETRVEIAATQEFIDNCRSGEAGVVIYRLEILKLKLTKLQASYANSAKADALIDRPDPDELRPLAVIEYQDDGGRWWPMFEATEWDASTAQTINLSGSDREEIPVRMRYPRKES